MHVVTFVVLLLMVSVLVGGAVLMRYGYRAGGGASESNRTARRCPKCGEMNPARARYCGHCGARTAD